MPISSKQIINFLTPGPNISIYPINNVYGISANTGSGGSVNGVTGITSSGTGNIHILSGINANNRLVYKTISGGPNITVYEAAGTIFISGSASSGSVNGATGVTSAGSGNILFISGLSNNNIVQKSILAGPNIGITEDNGTITISANSGSGSVNGVTGLTFVGGGIQPLSAISITNNLISKTISGGTNVTITESNGLIIVNSSGSGGSVNGVTGITSSGTGNIHILSGINANNRLVYKTISGSPNILVYEAADTIIISGTHIHTNIGGGVEIFSGTNSNINTFRTLSAGTNVVITTSATGLIVINNTLSVSGVTSSTLNTRVLEVSSAGTISASRGLTPFGIFNALTTTTISNSSTETSIISSLLYGSKTLNASTAVTKPHLITAKKFRFAAIGDIKTKNSGAGTLEIKIKLDSTTLMTTSAFTLVNNVNTPNIFEIKGTFTVRVQGASGKVIGGGLINGSVPFLTGGKHVEALFTQGELSLDTTSNKVFDCTAQFSLADSDNVINIYEATLEYLN